MIPRLLTIIYGARSRREVAMIYPYQSHKDQQSLSIPRPKRRQNNRGQRRARHVAHQLQRLQRSVVAREDMTKTG